MKQRMRIMVLLLGAVLGMGLLGANAAYADDTCTTFAADIASMSDTSTSGILTNITNFIKTAVGTASQSLFEAFTNSDDYQNAVVAAITLMIILYAVGFMIGIVQANFTQVLTRLLKIGFIFAVISPTGWSFFSTTVVHFFNDGSDQIIAKVISIGTGVPYDASKGPFTELDGLGKVLLTPDMVIAILGTTLNGGPYGFMMGALMSSAMFGLIKLFIKALQLYATAFVVRSLLIGVAPLFIVMILFERTKQLFVGWVNVMVYLTLQPILYFTFISFFIVMLSNAAGNMMGGNELCWSEFKQTSGTQNKPAFWRFKNPVNNNINVDKYDWNGAVSCYLNGGTEADGSACKDFPINIVDILSFLILIYVATKFGDVVQSITNEISNSFVNLDSNAKMAIDAASKNAGGDNSSGGNAQSSAAARPSSAQQTTRK